MTEIVLSVSRHQSHCVFSVEFVVFQCRMGEDMLAALIVAFYSYYKQRWYVDGRTKDVQDCMMWVQREYETKAGFQL